MDFDEYRRLACLSIATKPLSVLMELRARRYLVAQGLTFIGANYACRFGELDLIFKDNDCLVFVEVKYRSRASHGDAAAQVGLSKQGKMIRSAQFFLQKQGLNEYNTKYRFDVISLDGLAIRPRISWLKNAFFGA
ncbi:YraN family protein [Thalassotalea mangrovi]|uniref:UPF0102 protein E8M12_00470 n=1 Tax=Thalassotalea mangrovi TaxID=2572245 RepID=A0A4U1BAT7_9GAMM|nr:YraN family protein [Thalassotalea mangrovi]TKB47917.1 YraN family protein [Thalassotalea mangrovi]